MLIDVSYFMSGPRHIENVSVAEMPSPQSLAVNEVINGYIKAFQPEFLRNVVGVTLSHAITYVAPLKRQVSTWNSMVEKNKQFVEWAMSNDCPFDVQITKNLLTPINAFNL